MDFRSWKKRTMPIMFLVSLYAHLHHDREPESWLVSAVMRKELHSLTEFGMSVRDIGTIVLIRVKPSVF